MSGHPRSCGEIAAAVGAQEGALYRILRALAALGVFQEHDGRSFSLAPMGECLRSDAPQSLAPFAVFVGQEVQRQAWGQLLHAVKTGENAFQSAHGMTNWKLREQQPEQNAVFNAAMTSNSWRVNAALVRACPMKDGARIADIAGGQGALLVDFLTAYPQNTGVLLDRPHVVASAHRLLSVAGVLARCEVLGGDMFDAVPANCDVYLLKYVLHDWPDEDVLRILAACRKAMRKAARLVVFERWLGPPNCDASGKLADLGMMVGPGGLERTREELSQLLGQSGFRIVDSIATETPLNLLVAEPEIA
jgi:hypothetical protein